MNKTLFFMSLFAALNFGNLPNAAFKHEEISYNTVIKNNEEVLDSIDAYNPEPCTYSIDPTLESKYGRQNIVFNHVGDIESVWEQYRGDNVMVAVIDTGVDIRHDEFWIDGKCIVSNKSVYMYTDASNGNIVKESCGTNFENEVCLRPDNDGHGTGVAAVVAATATGNGIVGMAPNASILAIKIEFKVSVVCEAIKYAADCGADVINMSLGQREVTQSIVENYQDALDYAYAKGCIVCSAAGNLSVNDLFYPACLDHAIGVGALALNSFDTKAEYSNYNVYGRSRNNSDFMTPGSVYTAEYVEDGVSTYSQYYSNGTSFATPVMSGAAALYKQKYPNANQDDFYNALLSSCIDIGEPGWDEMFGHGALDVAKLLQVENAETANPTTTKVEDCTKIYWEDQIGWKFRTLHLYSLRYYEGFSESDFENFLTTYAGEASSRASWTFEGTSRKWCYNVEGNTGDYLVKPGGNSNTFSLNLPWWVTKAEYQFVNDNHWFPETNKPTVDIDSGRYHKELKSYIYNEGGNPKLSYVIGNAYTHAFDAVKVNRIVSTSSGTVKWSDSSYKTCVYDYMAAPEAYNLEGYRFIGWFLDSNFQKPYTKRIVKNDITLYGLVVPVDGRYYAPNVWNDGDLYAYEFYYQGDSIIEPLGSWPGTKMTEVKGVTYADHSLYYLDITLHSTGRLIFNDGFEKKTNKFPVAKSYLATYGTSWQYGTSGIPAVELIIDICNALDQVQASGSVKKASVCGLGPKASEFVTRYNALSSEAKGRFDASTLYTYKKDLTSGYENVTFADIITQLDEGTFHMSLTNDILVNNNTITFAVILAITTFATLAVAVLYFHKRQRYLD